MAPASQGYDKFRSTGRLQPCIRRLICRITVPRSDEYPLGEQAPLNRARAKNFGLIGVPWFFVSACSPSPHITRPFREPLACGWYRDLSRRTAKIIRAIRYAIATIFVFLRMSNPDKQSDPSSRFSRCRSMIHATALRYSSRGCTHLRYRANFLLTAAEGGLGIRPSHAA